MSLVYRSVVSLACEAQTADSLAEADALFESWARGKHPTLPGLVDSHAAEGGVELSFAAGVYDTGAATRCRLSEDLAHGAWWRTTLTVIVTPTNRWWWVDVEHVSDDAFGAPPTPSPPRFLVERLRSGTFTSGSLHLTASPITVSSTTSPNPIRPRISGPVQSPEAIRTVRPQSGSIAEFR